ncbi:MAG: hypothetical protein FWG55_04320, partial [Candidatus Bathyarchaeota archaeon]|nr:hypothetical protein [Candidatus Termiticorpusculum sp.]
VRVLSDDRNDVVLGDVKDGSSSSLSGVESGYPVVQVRDLESVGQVDLSKRSVVNGLIKERSEVLQGSVDGSISYDALKAVTGNQRAVEPFYEGVVRNSMDVQESPVVENKNVSTRLPFNEQKIIPQEFNELISASKDSWDHHVYQPKESLLKMQDRTQVAVAKEVAEPESLNSQVDVVELKPEKILTSEENSINKSTIKPRVTDNINESHPVYIEDTSDLSPKNTSTNIDSKKPPASPVFEVREFPDTIVDVAEEASKSSPTFEIRRKSLDTTTVDVQSDVPIMPRLIAKTDHAFSESTIIDVQPNVPIASADKADIFSAPLEKMVETKNQPEKNMPLASSPYQTQSFTSKTLTPTATSVTPSLNPVLQVTDNNNDGDSKFIMAKSPKPVLPVDTVFSKPPVQKEVENTVTIHIGRIEVHAVREQEQPVSLPREPVLSLSDYLKQRLERN